MKMRLLLTLSICAVLLLASLLQSGTSPKNHDLVVHQCNESDILTTTIRVFVDQSIDTVNQEEIKVQLAEFVATSNQTLQTSCIPVERRLTNITFIDNAFTPYNAKEFSLLYDRMLSALPASDKQAHLESLTDFIVVVLKALPADYKGYTYPEVVARMATITLDGSRYVLEHELGHLAMAGHERTGLGWFQAADSQAHAYHCGPYRTVMNENRKDGVAIGLYSNPNISIGAQSCGVEGEANNSEVLRQWAAFTREKLKLLERARG